MDKIKVHTYNVELEVLTPLIINTGEYYQFGELLPTGEKAKIKNPDKDIPLPVIFKFVCNDTSNMFKGMHLNGIKRFVDKATVAIMKGDNETLVDLRDDLIRRTGVEGKMPVRVLRGARRDLTDKPDKQVGKIAQSPIDMKTYIPGSSIKGAIRTGLLEQLRKKQGIDHWASLTDYDIPSYRKNDLPKQKSIKNAQDFEMEVMKNRKTEFKILEDPFKYLKVSDFLFSGVDAMTYITKVGEDEPIYSAMTNSYAFSGKPVVARGTISIDDRFYRNIDSIGVTSPDGLFEMVSRFYLDNINSAGAQDAVATDLMRYVSDKMNDRLNNGSYLMRFGHYTGIQNCTFKVNQINPPAKHPSHDINMTGGRIVRLEEGVLPGICTVNKIEEVV